MTRRLAAWLPLGLLHSAGELLPTACVPSQPTNVNCFPCFEDTCTAGHVWLESMKLAHRTLCHPALKIFTSSVMLLLAKSMMCQWPNSEFTVERQLLA